jgi:hypothetical protein
LPLLMKLDIWRGFSGILPEKSAWMLEFQFWR